MREHEDVLATLTQWRHLQVEYIEAVEQVFTEGAFGDHALQVAVGGADDAHIDLDLTVAPSVWAMPNPWPSTRQA
ncbi:hypothetical protein D3C75_1325060 [compost metagenome]